MCSLLWTTRRWCIANMAAADTSRLSRGCTVNNNLSNINLPSHWYVLNFKLMLMLLTLLLASFKCHDAPPPRVRGLEYVHVQRVSFLEHSPKRHGTRLPHWRHRSVTPLDELPLSILYLYYPLLCKGNYSVTSNNMKLVQWSLMSGCARRWLDGAAARLGPSSLYQM